MKQQKDGTSNNKNAVILTFIQSSTFDQLLMNISKSQEIYQSMIQMTM